MHRRHRANLIRRHERSCTLKWNETGKHVGGKYVEGTPRSEDRRGAFIPFSERRIYQSGGTFTTKDREFYTTKRIDLELSEITAYILYNRDKYKVEEESPFDEYGDFFVYRLKWVSAFDRSQTD